jgi:hypothetical protein
MEFIRLEKTSLARSSSKRIRDFDVEKLLSYMSDELTAEEIKLLGAKELFD